MTRARLVMVVPLATGRELARRIHVSPMTISKAVQRGALTPAFRAGRVPLFTPEQVDTARQTMRTRAPKEAA